MGSTLSLLTGLLLRAFVVALAANEVRGVVLAGPVLYDMHRSGSSLMAIWLGFCSLGGILLSVLVPLLIARKLKLIEPRLAA